MDKLEFATSKIDSVREIHTYFGYGYEVIITRYLDNGCTSVRIVPIKYKNEFHHSFDLSYNPDFGFTVVSSFPSPVFTTEKELNELAEGFKTAKELFNELERRKGELLHDRFIR